MRKEKTRRQQQEKASTLHKQGWVRLGKRAGFKRRRWRWRRRR